VMEFWGGIHNPRYRHYLCIFQYKHVLKVPRRRQAIFIAPIVDTPPAPILTATDETAPWLDYLWRMNP
jgi:hypothetical protein